MTASARLSLVSLPTDALPTASRPDPQLGWLELAVPRIASTGPLPAIRNLDWLGLVGTPIPPTAYSPADPTLPPLALSPIPSPPSHNLDPNSAGLDLRPLHHPDRSPSHHSQPDLQFDWSGPAGMPTSSTAYPLADPTSQSVASPPTNTLPAVSQPDLPVRPYPRLFTL
ncbi:hypothetical protein FRC10_005549 [Ceratobasidium sp. 414]|nr:hypothetical protein FRC10_005549 [Ceratobasidium sp. 414]